VKVPPVIVLAPAAKRVRVMLTLHAARSPALPVPVPEKVAEVEVNAVSTPVTPKVFEAGAATAAAGNAADIAVVRVATATANEILMAIPPIFSASDRERRLVLLLRLAEAGLPEQMRPKPKNIALPGSL